MVAKRTVVANDVGRRLTFTYDAAGERTVLRDPDGGRTSYTYDANGRMTVLKNPLGERTSYTYDTVDRRTLKRMANGTRTSMSYGGSNSLSAQYHFKSDGSVISGFTYNYLTNYYYPERRLDNRRRAIENTGDVVTWVYDSAYRLTRDHRSGANAYRTTLTYDNADNRATKREGAEITTYTYDAGNRLTKFQDSTGRTTLTYDASGNTRSIREPSGNITTNAWDYENHITQVMLPTGAIHTYVYDFSHHRVAAIDDLGVATSFLYDGDNVLLETDDTGLTQRSYTVEPTGLSTFGAVVNEDGLGLVTNTPGGGGLQGGQIGASREGTGYGNYVSQREDSTSSFHHFDAIGSTRQLTDSAQVVSDEYTFKAFGETVAQTGATPNPHEWVAEQGYYHDEATDRHTLMFNIYSALFSRFLAQDAPPPKGGDDPNRYLYVGNNPVNVTDPSGLDSTTTVVTVKQKWGSIYVIVEDAEDPALDGFVGIYSPSDGRVLLHNASGGCTYSVSLSRVIIAVRSDEVKYQYEWRNWFLRNGRNDGLGEFCAPPSAPRPEPPPPTQVVPPVVGGPPPMEPEDEPPEDEPTDQPTRPVELGKEEYRWNAPELPSDCEWNREGRTCFIHIFKPATPWWRFWNREPRSHIATVSYPCSATKAGWVEDEQNALEQVRSIVLLRGLRDISSAIRTGVEVVRVGVEIWTPGGELRDLIEFVHKPSVWNGVAVILPVAAGGISRGAKRCAAVFPTLPSARNFSRGSRTFSLVEGNASSGWKHIYGRHVDPNRFPGRSKFDCSLSQEDIIDLLGRTIKHGNETSFAGDVVFTYKTNFKSTGYQRYRATVNSVDRTVRTFHPLDLD